MQINGVERMLATNKGIEGMLAVNNRSARHPVVLLLAVIVFAECALMIGASLYLIVELLTATPDSYVSAIALTVLTILAAIWLGVIAVSILRGRAWTRGATIVWQVLQFAVALGCLQGVFAQPAIGWVLLVPAVVAFILTFTPPVVASSSSREG